MLPGMTPRSLPPDPSVVIWFGLAHVVPVAPALWPLPQRRNAAMTAETIALVTAVATALLFLVTWRAASAAKQNAEIAAREFRLLRRPLVTVTWGDPHVVGGAVDDGLFLFGAVKEVAGFATTLHSHEANATPVYDPSTPAVQTGEHSTVLSGEEATQPVVLILTVPHWWRDGRPAPSTAALKIRNNHAARDSVVIAVLAFRVVISAADEEATREEWELRGVLSYDRTQQRYVLPRRMSSARLGERAPGRRSRIIDPVLRAWERWWDSVG